MGHQIASQCSAPLTRTDLEVPLLREGLAMRRCEELHETIATEFGARVQYPRRQDPYPHNVHSRARLCTLRLSTPHSLLTGRMLTHSSVAQARDARSR